MMGVGGGRRKIRNPKIGRWSRERDLSGSRQREDLMRAGSGARRTLQSVGEPQRDGGKKVGAKGQGAESETGRQ
ncbi:unnamed protein product [Sphagnum troendelagicum]|uniref:Uncharacterized protein n=1 Tax=Sphagnum troendelagicum TaxID=128251 RepID=A0ABP0UR97_9BRYO